MVKIINICSGKGGVGKTTISANLGLAMQSFGKRVAVVDCNFTTSHLSLLFGLYSYPKSLNHFLRNECTMDEATFTHVSGLKIVPASLDLNDIINVDAENLKAIINQYFSNYDAVILDSAPGMGKEAMIALKASDEVIFVANPHITSIVDVGRINQLVKSMGYPKPVGIILNRVKGKGYEVSHKDIWHFAELPIIGTVPEDDKVLESLHNKELLSFTNPHSKFSVEIFDSAAKLSNVPYRKPSRFQMFMSNFRKQKRAEDFNRLYPNYSSSPYGGV